VQRDARPAGRRGVQPAVGQAEVDGFGELPLVGGHRVGASARCAAAQEAAGERAGGVDDVAPVPIGVPTADAGAALRADVVVEAYRIVEGERPDLLSRGEARDVLLETAGEVPILLAPVETFACAAGRLNRGRAFHSVTPLPNGELLLLGGVVSHPDPEVINLNNPLGGGLYGSQVHWECLP